ncbi:MAG: LppU/SCO3897 family protein [Acidimicrobiales bacterium]
MAAPEETTHRGVLWRRDREGRASFYDADGERWVRWAPGVDAPPVPPGWAGRRRIGQVERPQWRSPWRIVPLVIIAVVIVAALVQVLRPSTGQTKKEAAASAALLGKCLAQDGTANGHPKYSATPVSCASPQAAVKVLKVIPSTPGSPLCPNGLTGVELPYAGVRYLHVECVEPVRHDR